MISQKVPIQTFQVIPAYSCVTASGELANNQNPAHNGHVIGVTEGVMNGIPANPTWGNVIVVGTIFNEAWSWTPGGQIYLGGTVLTQTQPVTGFVLRVGWALTAQSMLVLLAAV